MVVSTSMDGLLHSSHSYLHANQKGKMKQNTFLNQWKKGDFSGCLTSASFPPGVVSVPFEWRYMRSDTVHHMRFFAGVMVVIPEVYKIGKILYVHLYREKWYRKVA